MPTLLLRTTHLMTDPLAQQLASELTQITANTLGKRPAVTAVVIDSVAARRWFIGAGAADAPTAWLDINITEGTNTAAEKVAFVAAAFALLNTHLGPLAPGSYVHVRELAASDWGYGGLTQQARKIAGAAPASALAL